MRWDVLVVDAAGQVVERRYSDGWHGVQTFVTSLPDGVDWLRMWVRLNPDLRDARFGIVRLRSADPLEQRERRIDLYSLRLG